MVFIVLCGSPPALIQDLFDLSLEEVLSTRINSVSGIAEKATEAPAPVSVITESMIKNSGVYSIRDLLTLYVPASLRFRTKSNTTSLSGAYTPHHSESF